MARIGRLAGALVVETAVRGEAAWFLVGDTKVPCDWDAAGFQRPTERDAKAERYVRLVPTAAPSLHGPTLQLFVEGESAARLIADRLLVARNGAVSDRLWRLVLGENDASTPSHAAELDARWLAEIPAHVWDVVRDAVLKCT
jgi:hypothetical protein